MANLLQWFVSASAALSKGSGMTKILQKDFARLFFSDDGDTVGLIESVYEKKNSNILFTPKDETSYWHKYTFRDAVRIDEDPEKAAEKLLEALHPASYERFGKELRASFYEKRSEHERPDFRKSRFETLLDALSSDVPMSDRSTAVIMCRLYAEAVFFLQEGAFRPDNGGIVAELMEKGGASVPAASSGKNNVYMKDRRSLEKEYLIGELMEGASNVWMYNMTITGLVWGREKKGVIDHKRGIFERCLDGGTRFTVIIPEPGSIGEEDSAESKLCQTYPGNLSSLEVMKKTRDQLINDIDERSREGEASPISLYFTSYAVPYSMMLVKFDDQPERDHVKIDLHTPYLPQDLDRRSFYIFRKDDPLNFKFFEDNYAVIRLNSIPYTRWKRKHER